MASGEMAWTSALGPIIAPEIATEIISRIADVAVLLSEKGRINSVLTNPNFRSIGDLSSWQGRAFKDVLNVESVPKFEQRLASFLEHEGAVRPVELNHKAQGTMPEFPMRYSFHRIGGAESILILGHDLRPIADMQQQLVAAQIALEKDYEAQREYDIRLRVLLAATREAVVFASVSSGEIVDCNPAATILLGTPRTELVGADFASYFASGSGTNLLSALAKEASEQSNAEVRAMMPKQKTEMLLQPILFRTAGEQMLLIRILEQNEARSPSDDLPGYLSALFESGPDGIVFVNRAGQILSANEAFLGLTDIAQPQALRGRSLTDFLGRGSVDLNVIRENAERSGSMRLYATRMISALGLETQVEIATSHLTASDTPVFGLVIRDAGRSGVVRGDVPGVTDVDMRSVIELIGNQTLKDIVAKTTDVIEKMCIEAAVELTSNNRVAAAEMLGLSRQSLYVKLRKYNLLS